MSLTRSEQMARIRGRDTRPERLLARALWARGFRYRLHRPTSAGRPDLVFPGRHVAVFVDGCFWHGCPQHYVRPRSREAFWAAKLRRNVDRDRKQTLALEAAGWRVHRVWEHEVLEDLQAVADRLAGQLQHPRPRRPDWRVVRVVEIDGARNLERREMEDLRNARQTRERSGRRSTRKWGRPRSSAD